MSARKQPQIHPLFFAVVGIVAISAQSQGKIVPVGVTGSGDYAEHKVSNLIDGNLRTKWAYDTKNGAPAQAVFDFGRDVVLSSITVYSAESGGEGPNLNAEDYECFAGPSPDGPWTSLFKVTDNLRAQTTNTFPSVSTRYVRLEITDPMSMTKPNMSNDDNIVRMPEVEFFGPNDGAPAVMATIAPLPPAGAPTPRPTAVSGSFPFMMPGEPAATGPAGMGGSGALGAAAPPAPTPSVTAGPGQVVVGGVAWHTDVQAAHGAAVADGKRILVFFRLGASRWQAQADAVLAEPAVCEVLAKRNVFLVIDSQKSPQLTTTFRVIRMPSLSVWTTQGAEIGRLEGESITRDAVLRLFQ